MAVKYETSELGETRGLDESSRALLKMMKKAQINSNELSENLAIEKGDNASLTGPYTIPVNANKKLTVKSGGKLKIVGEFKVEDGNEFIVEDGATFLVKGDLE